MGREGVYMVDVGRRENQDSEMKMCPGQAGQGARDTSSPLALFTCFNLLFSRLFSEPISGILVIPPTYASGISGWDTRVPVYVSVTHGCDEKNDHKQLWASNYFSRGKKQLC